MFGHAAAYGLAISEPLRSPIWRKKIKNFKKSVDKKVVLHYNKSILKVYLHEIKKERGRT